MTNPASRPNELRGVILPTGVADILLPSISMAEVVSDQAPAPCAGAPGWLLGMVTWRGCAVPLISLAAEGTEPLEGVRRQRARIVILYTPSGNSALPYLGIRTVGLPRLTRLSPQLLEQDSVSSENPLVLYAVELAGRSACIPDMDAIEQAILAVIQP